MRQSAKFVVCGVLALAGCSGTAQNAPAIVPGGAPSAQSPAATGETLKFTKIAVKTGTCLAGSGNASFTARGTAHGPHSGTLTASGAWSFYNLPGQKLWTFSETFKITGAGAADGTITGNGSTHLPKCTAFGPISSLHELTFHMGTATGSATTTLVKNGANVVELLH